MKIRKGDNVEVRSGKDRGKKGTVLRVLPRVEKVVVEKINIAKRHRRARKVGEKGQIIAVERPIAVSTVMLLCPQCGKRTRVGYVIKEHNSKMRVCKKCGAEVRA
ncbi:MAG TPA: 50S ribosomal protein L24 [Patescibacteria group bacterium]|nr:50S ribosomal protein L24 [Patescibacteria group bacterium]